MVTAGDSQIIDVGRKTRTIPVPTRRAVLARDGGCTYPGCHHRDGIEVHHIRHWANLGPTDLNNLACLCWRHHRLVHEGGWGLTMDLEIQRTIWTAPDGRRLIGQRRATAGAPAHHHRSGLTPPPAHPADHPPTPDAPTRTGAPARPGRLPRRPPPAAPSPGPPRKPASPRPPTQLRHPDPQAATSPRPPVRLEQPVEWSYALPLP